MRKLLREFRHDPGGYIGLTMLAVVFLGPGILYFVYGFLEVLKWIGGLFG